MEIWKDIKSFENMYKISDKGNVYSLKTNKCLSLKRLTKDGYNHVALFKEGKSHDKKIHRLVAEHFIENVDNKPTINHKDGNKQNNSVENLEWMTREENMQHAYDLGLKVMPKGHEHPNSKLTEKERKEILETYKRYKKGFGSVALAKKYNVESSTILRLVKKHRTCND